MKTAILPANTTLAPVGELTGKQRAFAEHYAENGNAVAAYLHAYDVAPGTANVTVRKRAHELSHTPAIRTAIRALQDAAATGTVMSIRSRMAWLQSIVDADPSELQSIVGGACRWCWGRGGYHYRNAQEFARMADEHAQSKGLKPVPPAIGAFGYRGDAASNPDCDHCDGRGITEAIVTPSDQWSPAARALFAGVKHKPDGKIEIQMVSKLAAADQLSKLQGAYVDRSININANVAVPPLKDMTRDDALAFLDSLRPAV